MISNLLITSLILFIVILGIRSHGILSGGPKIWTLFWDGMGIVGGVTVLLCLYMIVDVGVSDEGSFGEWIVISTIISYGFVAFFMLSSAWLFGRFLGRIANLMGGKAAGLSKADQHTSEPENRKE